MLSPDEWLMTRDIFEAAINVPSVLKRIVQRRFGLSHKLNQTVGRLQTINREYKNLLDQIICNAYPSDIEDLPGTDIPIHGVFYNYNSIVDIPDMLEPIKKLPKVFTPAQKDMLISMIEDAEKNIDCILGTFNNEVSYKSPYYNYTKTVRAMYQLRGKLDIEYLNLRKILTN